MGSKIGAREQVKKIRPSEPEFGEHQPTIWRPPPGNGSRRERSEKRSKKLGQRTGPKNGASGEGRENHFQKMGPSSKKSPLSPCSDSVQAQAPTYPNLFGPIS